MGWCSVGCFIGGTVDGAAGRKDAGGRKDEGVTSVGLDGGGGGGGWAASGGGSKGG